MAWPRPGSCRTAEERFPPAVHGRDPQTSKRRWAGGGKRGGGRVDNLPLGASPHPYMIASRGGLLRALRTSPVSISWPGCRHGCRGRPWGMSTSSGGQAPRRNIARFKPVPGCVIHPLTTAPEVFWGIGTVDKAWTTRHRRCFDRSAWPSQAGLPTAGERYPRAVHGRDPEANKRRWAGGGKRGAELPKSVVQPLHGIGPLTSGRPSIPASVVPLN